MCIAAMAAVIWVRALRRARRRTGHRPPPAAAVVQKAGSQTLEILDRAVFKPSQLDETSKKRLLAHFQPLIQSHEGLHLQVVFRQGGRLGANAFALPAASSYSPMQW